MRYGTVLFGWASPARLEWHSGVGLSTLNVPLGGPVETKIAFDKSDEELIMAAAAGDADALGQLYERHKSLVMKSIRLPGFSVVAPLRT